MLYPCKVCELDADDDFSWLPRALFGWCDDPAGDNGPSIDAPSPAEAAREAASACVNECDVEWRRGKVTLRVIVRADNAESEFEVVMVSACESVAKVWS